MPSVAAGMTAGLAAFFGVALGGMLLVTDMHFIGIVTPSPATYFLSIQMSKARSHCYDRCFDVAVAGSLFALEVLHRSGMQFYEVSIRLIIQ